ncbi:MAG: hypothetical protein V4819_00650 [Verrucomicrobiota bacterium]
MKYQILAILGCALFTANLAHSAILTVDNKPGAVAMFTSFQAAYNAAQTGDTIMLAGSPTGYTAPWIYKRLNIVGPGYLFAENQILGITSHHASISLTFAKNNQFGDASGSSVSGVYCTIGSAHGAGENMSVPVSLSRCRIQAGGGFGPGSSVSNSLFDGSLDIYGSTSVRNCIFTNYIYVNGIGNTFSSCTIFSQQSGHFQIRSDTHESTSWSNIVFVNSVYTAQAFASLKMGSVTHSIAVGNSLLPGGRASFLPEGGGNINGFNLTDVFVASGNSETRWMLNASSPAIGAGFNGVDMGAFGGANPYRLSGVAPRPRITRFVVPAAATDATGLQFEVDAKAF